jgi:hypothetical protein
MRSSAVRNSVCQGQRAGILSRLWRPERARRPGIVSSRRRRVRAVRIVASGEAMVLVQRSRLWAGAAIAQQRRKHHAGVGDRPLIVKDHDRRFVHHEGDLPSRAATAAIRHFQALLGRALKRTPRRNGGSRLIWTPVSRGGWNCGVVVTDRWCRAVCGGWARGLAWPTGPGGRRVSRPRAARSAAGAAVSVIEGRGGSSAAGTGAVIDGWSV